MQKGALSASSETRVWVAGRFSMYFADSANAASLSWPQELHFGSFARGQSEPRDVGTFKCIIPQWVNGAALVFSLPYSLSCCYLNCGCVGVCVCVFVCKCTPNAFRFLQIAIIVVAVQQTKQK